MKKIICWLVCTTILFGFLPTTFSLTTHAAHTHNLIAIGKQDLKHPHQQLFQCSCGQVEIKDTKLTSCTTCYPPKSHVHSFKSVGNSDAKHPHSQLYQCSCGQVEYRNTWLISCTICNPQKPCTHNFKAVGSPDSKHPHSQLYQCFCGQVEYRNTQLTTCTICNPPKPCVHNFKAVGSPDSKHPHSQLYQCSCGQVEYRDTQLTTCTTCNPPKPCAHNFKAVGNPDNKHPHEQLYVCDCGDAEIRYSDLKSCNLCNPSTEHSYHTYRDYVFYVRNSDETHDMIVHYECDCGKTMPSINTTYTITHEFDLSGVCRQCGYEDFYYVPPTVEVYHEPYALEESYELLMGFRQLFKTYIYYKDYTLDKKRTADIGMMLLDLQWQFTHNSYILNHDDDLVREIREYNYDIKIMNGETVTSLYYSIRNEDVYLFEKWEYDLYFDMLADMSKRGKAMYSISSLAGGLEIANILDVILLAEDIGSLPSNLKAIFESPYQRAKKYYDKTKDNLEILRYSE